MLDSVTIGAFSMCLVGAVSAQQPMSCQSGRAQIIVGGLHDDSLCGTARATLVGFDRPPRKTGGVILNSNLTTKEQVVQPEKQREMDRERRLILQKELDRETEALRSTESLRLANPSEYGREKVRREANIAALKREIKAAP